MPRCACHSTRMLTRKKGNRSLAYLLPLRWLCYHQFTFNYLNPAITGRAVVIINNFTWYFCTGTLWTSWVSELIKNLPCFFTVWLFKNFYEMSFLSWVFQDEFVRSLWPESKSFLEFELESPNFPLDRSSIQWILDSEDESFFLFNLCPERLNLIFTPGSCTDKKLHFVSTIENFQLSIVKYFFKSFCCNLFHGCFE